MDNIGCDGENCCVDKEYDHHAKVRADREEAGKEKAANRKNNHPAHKDQTTEEEVKEALQNNGLGSLVDNDFRRKELSQRESRACRLKPGGCPNGASDLTEEDMARKASDRFAPGYLGRST